MYKTKLQHMISSKYAQHLKYFFRNGIWVVLTQFFSLVLSFSVSVAMTRYLPKATYGQYQFVVVCMTLFSLFSFPGLVSSIIKSVSSGFEQSFLKANKYSFRMSFLALPLFLLLTGYYFFQKEQLLGFSLALAGISFPFIYGHDKWLAYWKGKEKFKFISIRQIINSSFINLSLILCVWFFSRNLIVVVVVYLSTNAIVQSYWNWRTVKAVSKSDIDDDCIPYGKYLTKMSFLAMFVQHIDKLLIGYWDIEVLAVYMVALKLYNIIKQVFKSITSMSMSKFSKNELVIENKGVVVIFALLMVFSTLLYFFSSPVITWIYTEKYLDAGSLFSKLVFVLPLSFINPLFGFEAHANKHKTKIFLSSVVSPIVSILISLLAFVFYRNIEWFILVKVYSLQIINFFVLVLLFNNQKARS